MEKKVSAAQIGELYEFTRRHFVEHYDLQTELVDHLAQSIEQQWEQNTQTNFEEALSLAFKEFGIFFGIFGFSDIVEQRRAALTKRYNRFIRKQFKTFFRLPKILLAILATFTFYKLMQLSPLIFIVLLFPVFIISIRQMYLLNKKYKAKNKNTGKRWMLEEILYSFGSLGVAFNGPLQMYIHIPEYSMAPWVSLLFSTVFVLFIIYDYVILYVVPEKAESLLEETYPEYRLEKLS